MSDSVDAKKRLVALRDATQRFGVIYPEQIEHLRMWPLVLVRGCRSAQVTIDVDGKKVAFELALSARQRTGEPQLRKLVVGVQWLLGAEWSIEVRRAGDEEPIFLKKAPVADGQTKFSGTDFAAGKVVPTPWKFQVKK